jgi:hypothetical protein
MIRFAFGCQCVIDGGSGRALGLLFHKHLGQSHAPEAGAEAVQHITTCKHGSGLF